MKRKFLAFVVLLAATLSLSSCLSSDDDTNVEYTHDTAITAFSLGSLDRYVKTAAGKDTLLKSNITGSNYKFYIDQTTRQIYNPDSLPCGVRDTAVLATITSKNSSPIVLMDIDKTDSVAAYYSSSDSINFSKPRQIRVYNNDFSAYVTYTVTINIHKQLPNEFNWQNKAQLHAGLHALSHLKALAVNGAIYVFGQAADGMKIYKTANTDGANWEEVEANVVFAATDYQNAVTMNGALYILSDGKVYTSADAKTWQLKASDASLKQLVGASTKYLYAYTATGISVSKDQGSTWTAETLDADIAKMPVQNLSMIVSGIRSTKNAENVMLVGTRATEYQDSIASIWNHTIDYADDAPEYAWNYMEYDNHQPYKMYSYYGALVCAADTGFVALGNDGTWLKSVNAGLYWKKDTLVSMPTEFTGAPATSAFAFCRDENKYYWVIRNGYVWKGRFNRDGWIKE